MSHPRSHQKHALMEEFLQITLLSPNSQVCIFLLFQSSSDNRLVPIEWHCLHVGRSCSQVVEG